MNKLKLLLCAGIAGVSLMVFAQNSEHSLGDQESQCLVEDSVLSHRDDCRYYRHRWECEDNYNCEWNYSQRICRERYDDGDDYYRSCERIRSPLACSNRDDCFWSPSRDRCVNSRGGGDNSFPRICYETYSRWECERIRGCHWSRYFDRCVGPDDA